MGCTATTDLGQESEAILLSVGGVFILFSIIALAESFHPEHSREHSDYNEKSQSKSLYLFYNFFLFQAYSRSY